MKVIVYSTTTCPFCVQLKRWLEHRDVAYTEYQVDRNPYAAQVMVQQSGQMGVPFTTIEHDDGSVDKILGFDRGALERSLRRVG